MAKSNDLDVGNSYFNAKNQINKYSLDHSTFDILDVDRFHNTDCSTVCSYLLTWILMILSIALLGVDIYTCLNIFVFHRWSSDDYKPYAYNVAKWIFTGCIIFQFCLLFYHWMWAIHTYKTRNIALAYVNSITRMLYVFRSYNYHCLFNQIEKDNFFDWACFLTYGELDNALQILVADTPRQVINVLTLRNYATNDNTSNDILKNIKNIAETNIRLSIILSFMVLSLAIWSVFFFKFVFGMLMYIPVKIKLRNKKYRSLKKYCCSVVNDNVRLLVFRNHKPKDELLEKGILDLKDINANPLLSSATGTFKYNGDEDEGFIYRNIPHSGSQSSLSGPRRSSDITSLNDSHKPRTNSFGSLAMDDLLSKRYQKSSIPRSGSNLRDVHYYNESTTSLQDPFDDGANQGLMHSYSRSPVRRPPPHSESQGFKNPFSDSQESVDSSPIQPLKLKHKDSSQTINTVTYSIDNDSFITSYNQRAASIPASVLASSSVAGRSSSMPFTSTAMGEGSSSISVPAPAPTRHHRLETGSFDFKDTNYSRSSAFTKPDGSQSKYSSFSSTTQQMTNSTSQHSNLSYPISVHESESVNLRDMESVLENNTSQTLLLHDLSAPYPTTEHEVTPYPVRGVSMYGDKKGHTKQQSQ